jgi:DNA-binding transcriptional ArsR family regulator
LLERLREGEASVGALARPFRMSLRGLLKHVRVLEQAGLVATRKLGRTRLVRLAPQALTTATGFLDAYREIGERFDARAPFIDLSDMDVT